ncbi:diacylglycerol kinase family protein, partial [Escherichia coli]
KRGFEVGLRATERQGAALTMAQRLASDADVIVAVGGDGTINEVANGMAVAGASGRHGHRARLGIVPAGTVNVLALELGLPFQVERACNVI